MVVFTKNVLQNYAWYSFLSIYVDEKERGQNLKKNLICVQE